jgi:hypothetical protein
VRRRRELMSWVPWPQFVRPRKPPDVERRGFKHRSHGTRRRACNSPKDSSHWRASRGGDTAQGAQVARPTPKPTSMRTGGDGDRCFPRAVPGRYAGGIAGSPPASPSCPTPRPPGYERDSLICRNFLQNHNLGWPRLLRKRALQQQVYHVTHVFQLVVYALVYVFFPRNSSKSSKSSPGTAILPRPVAKSRRAGKSNKGQNVLFVSGMSERHAAVHADGQRVRLSGWPIIGVGAVPQAGPGLRPM